MPSFFGFDSKAGSKAEFERRVEQAKADVHKNGGKFTADRTTGKVTVEREVRDAMGTYKKTKEIE